MTGASAGLGEAFAKQIAQRGMNLVLVARRKEKLEALATSLVNAHGIAVKTVVLDLGREGAAEEFARQTSEIDIGLVVMTRLPWFWAVLLKMISKPSGRVFA
ncbi:SDR family NAD(P)-dependent oxidoreductase [Bradyrhizobium sp. 139]|uniref:SDR family NAD(P)-dependent oxidoreductase n=1 Tax=Bradyrhizobium sp. 139 TaxID=2782616 RepID=UPI0031FEBCD9|nr:SDR family NAD(P)-dependent oxidoreductase [Bradyrhizobium sp. 139]